MPEDDGTLASAGRDGTRLVRHPMKQYERPNLGFVQAGFGSEDVPRADVVRAFNVLLYYDTELNWCGSRRGTRCKREIARRGDWQS
jgi:hypothetical protein